MNFGEGIIPQRVSCSNCSEMLHEGKDIRPPDDVIHNYEGKCPKCGSILSLIPIRIDVTPTKRKKGPRRPR